MKFKKGDIVRRINEDRNGNQWIYKIVRVIRNKHDITESMIGGFLNGIHYDKKDILKEKRICYEVNRYDKKEEVWDFWFLYEDEIYKLDEKELLARLI